MNSYENAIERSRWWLYFIQGDFDRAAAQLAPDMIRRGPRIRDNNFQIVGRANYMAFLKEVWPTQPRINESVIHEITASPDGRRSYLSASELDSYEPNSREKTILVSMLMVHHFNDDGLISLVDSYWKEPEINYEWTGTAK